LSYNDHGIYTIDELNEISSIVMPQYAIVHLNTRSLNTHFNDLIDLLDSLRFNFDFIGCSETWISSQLDLERYNLENYNLIGEQCEMCSGGGVALFIRSHYTYIIRNDLKIDGIENLWIETQELIIGLVYKPPKFSNHQFLESLEQTLHNIYLSKKKCFIMGDINIDTIKKNKTAKDYLKLLHSEGFLLL